MVGDEKSQVGVGYGKANEVPLAIQKAVERAKKNLFKVPMHGTTITHQTTGVFGAGRVFLKPASEGTGVIAGGGVRAVLELAGIRDVLSKSLGSQNPINLVKATMTALQTLRSPDEVAELRGLKVGEVLGPPPKRRTATRSPRRPPSADAPPLSRRPPSRSPQACRGHLADGRTLKLTQFKSKNGANPKPRETLRTLGLGKIGRTTEREDHPAARRDLQGPPSREGRED